MFETLNELPVAFFTGFAVLLVGVFIAFAKLRSGIGIPMLISLATVFVWYFFDIFYNDYLANYQVLFDPGELDTAWRHVFLFLVVFVSATPALNYSLNRRYLGNKSYALERFYQGANEPILQRQLRPILKGAVIIWCGLILFAVLRYQSALPLFFFPYLFGHPGPWLASGVGGGANSIFALAVNFHMLVAMIFGVVAALAKNRRVRMIALFCIFLSWPLFIFDRTRGYILIIFVPGLLAWVFVRFRATFLAKLVVLAVLYLVVNAWFGFIIAARGTGTSVVQALLNGQFDFFSASEEKHQGLNMFEELAWISILKENNQLPGAPGYNYFANIVNIIPRSLWPGKPTIGLDYAIARGLGSSTAAVGVVATLSFGIIGQGVVNFGLYLGAVAAALIFSLWCCLLARFDLRAREKLGYFPLFGLGLITTFTLGRDISILNLYPLIFGYFVCRLIDRKARRKNRTLHMKHR